MENDNLISTKECYEKTMNQLSKLISAVQFGNSDNISNSTNLNDEEFSKLIQKVIDDQQLIQSIQQQFSNNQIVSTDIRTTITELINQNKVLHEKEKSSTAEFKNLSEEYNNQIKQNKNLQKQNFSNNQSIKVLKMRLTMLAKAVNGEMVEENDSFDPTSMNIDEFINLVNQAFHDYDISSSIQKLFPTESKTALDISNKVTDLKSLISSLSKEVEDRTKLCNELVQKEKAASDQVALLNQEINSKGKEYDELNQNYENKCKENEELNQTVNSKSKEIDELKQNSEKKCKENEKLNQTINSISKEIDELKQNFENKSKENEELNQNYMKKCKEYDEIKQNYENKCKENEELNQKIKSISKEIEELKQNYENKCKENENICVQANDLDNVKKDLHLIIKAIDDQQNDSLPLNESTLSHLISKVQKDSDLSKAVQTLFPDNSNNGNDVINKINELNTKINDLEISNNKLESEREMHQSTVNKLEQQINDLIKQIDGENEEITDQIISEMCQKVAHMNEISKSIQKKLPNSSHNAQEVEKAIDDYEESIRNLTESNKQLNEKVQQLENELNTLKVNNENIINKQKDEIDIITGQLNDLKINNENLINSHKGEIDSIKGQLLSLLRNNGCDSNQDDTFDSIQSKIKNEIEIASVVHSIFPDSSNNSEQVRESIQKLKKSNELLKEILDALEINQTTELTKNEIISKAKLANELSNAVKQVLPFNSNDGKSVIDKINQMLNSNLPEIKSNQNEVTERSTPKFLEIEIEIEDENRDEIEEEEYDDEDDDINQQAIPPKDEKSFDLSPKFASIVSIIKGENVQIESINNDEFIHLIQIAQLNKDISNAVIETIPDDCDSYQSVKNEINQMKESIQHKEMENLELKQKLEVCQKELNELKQNKENQFVDKSIDLQQTNENFEKELNEVKAEVRSKSNELQELKTFNDNQLNELNTQLTNQTNEFNQLKSEHENQTNEFNQLKSEHENQTNEFNQLKSKHENQTNEFNQLKLEHENQTNELTTINEELQTTKSQLESLRNSIHSTNSDNSIENASFVKSIEQLFNEHSHDSLYSHISSLYMNHNKYETEIQQLKERLVQLINLIDHSKEIGQIDTIDDETFDKLLNLAKKKDEIYETIIELFPNDCDNQNQLKEAINNLFKRNETLVKEFDLKMKEANEKSRQLINQKEKQIKNLQKRIDKTTKDLKSLQNQLKESQARILDMEKQLNQTTSTTNISQDDENEFSQPNSILVKPIDASLILNTLTQQEIKDRFILLVNAINGQLDNLSLNRFKPSDQFHQLLKKTMLIQDLSNSAQSVLPYDCINGGKLKRKIDLLLSIKTRFGEQSDQLFELQNKIEQLTKQIESKEPHQNFLRVQKQLMTLINVIQGQTNNQQNSRSISQNEFNDIVKKAKENEDLAKNIKEILPNDSHNGQEVKEKIQFFISQVNVKKCQHCEELEIQLTDKDTQLKNAQTELSTLTNEIETLKNDNLMLNDRLSKRIQDLEDQLKSQVEQQRELEDKNVEEKSTEIQEINSEIQDQEAGNVEGKSEVANSSRYEQLLEVILDENEIAKHKEISDSEFQEIIRSASKDKHISHAVQKILPNDSKNGPTISKKLKEISNRSDVLNKKIKYLHFINLFSLIIICAFISIFFSK